MTSKQEFHIPVTTEGKTAVEYLSEASGISKQKIKQYMQKGCVWLERVKNNASDTNDLDKTKPLQKAYIQRLRRAKKILHSNEILHFYYDLSVLTDETADAVLIYDYGDYSIWNKPCGMLSQGSKWGDHTSIYRWAEKHLRPERLAFIVHRLDRAANGLIILAHKKSAASQFSKMFEKRQIEKLYQVKVEGDFSSIISKEANDLSSKKMITINDAIDGKTAISHAKFLAFNKDENTSSIEVQIETGRKHQIRKHLSNIGFPVVGDRLYGHHERNIAGLVDLQLQAKSLKFICPVTAEEREFTLDS